MDFSSVCRTCMSDSNLHPLFRPELDPIEEDYNSIIFLICSIKIEPDDGKPQKICSECINSINNYTKFSAQCLKSEIEFEDILEGKYEAKYANNEIKHKKVSHALHFDNDKSKGVEIKEESHHNDEDNKPLTLIINSKNKKLYIKDENSIAKLGNKDETSIAKSGNSDETSMAKSGNEQEINNTNLCNKNEENDIKNCYSDEMKNTSAETKDIDEEESKIRVICEICNKNLSKRSIDLHIARCHPGADQRRVKCELCDSFVTKKKLSRHNAMMHGEECLRCSYCKNDMKNKDALIEHVVTCLAKTKKRKPCESSRVMQECDICHKVMQRASLRMHKAVTHAGLGPVCEHCGMRLGNKLRLQEHYRAKHGYEKLKCSYCDFRSASASALRDHERRHRGEKPFVCESCGAKFHAAYLLAQHKQSHRTDKIYKCNQCSGSFKVKHTLSLHQQTCHSRRTFACSVCSRAFSCRLYAARHVRRAHKCGSTELIQTD